MSLNVVTLFYEYKFRSDNLVLQYQYVFGVDNFVLLIKNYI